MFNIQALVLKFYILSTFQINEAFLKSNYAQNVTSCVSSYQIELNISKSKTVKKILSKRLYYDFY